MHTLWKLDREPCQRPTCLRCTLAFHRPPQLWRYGSLLERRTREIDLFLSPSRFTIGMHRERGFTRPMRQLPYFIPRADVAAPDPDRPGRELERPYFLVVAQAREAQGRADADRALRPLRRGRPRRRRRRHLRRASCAAQAAGLDHVRFLGSVPFYELASLYAGAIAVLAASIGYETFGMTTIEGFAQKTPAIVRDLGALPEAVEESGGGLRLPHRRGAARRRSRRSRTDPGLRDGARRARLRRIPRPLVRGAPPSRLLRDHLRGARLAGGRKLDALARLGRAVGGRDHLEDVSAPRERSRAALARLRAPRRSPRRELARGVRSPSRAGCGRSSSRDESRARPRRAPPSP